MSNNKQYSVSVSASLNSNVKNTLQSELDKIKDLNIKVNTKDIERVKTLLKDVKVSSVHLDLDEEKLISQINAIADTIHKKFSASMDNLGSSVKSNFRPYDVLANGAQDIADALIKANANMEGMATNATKLKTKIKNITDVFNTDKFEPEKYDKNVRQFVNSFKKLTNGLKRDYKDLKITPVLDVNEVSKTRVQNEIKSFVNSIKTDIGKIPLDVSINTMTIANGAEVQNLAKKLREITVEGAKKITGVGHTSVADVTIDYFSSKEIEKQSKKLDGEINTLKTKKADIQNSVDSLLEEKGHAKSDNKKNSLTEQISEKRNELESVGQEIYKLETAKDKLSKSINSNNKNDINNLLDEIDGMVQPTDKRKKSKKATESPIDVLKEQYYDMSNINAESVQKISNGENDSLDNIHKALDAKVEDVKNVAKELSKYGKVYDEYGKELNVSQIASDKRKLLSDLDNLYTGYFKAQRKDEDVSEFSKQILEKNEQIKYQDKLFDEYIKNVRETIKKEQKQTEAVAKEATSKTSTATSTKSKSKSKTKDLNEEKLLSVKEVEQQALSIKEQIDLINKPLDKYAGLIERSVTGLRNRSNITPDVLRGIGRENSAYLAAIKVLDRYSTLRKNLTRETNALGIKKGMTINGSKKLSKGTYGLTGKENAEAAAAAAVMANISKDLSSINYKSISKKISELNTTLGSTKGMSIKFDTEALGGYEAGLKKINDLTEERMRLSDKLQGAIRKEAEGYAEVDKLLEGITTRMGERLKPFKEIIDAHEAIAKASKNERDVKQNELESLSIEELNGIVDENNDAIERATMAIRDRKSMTEGFADSLIKEASAAKKEAEAFERLSRALKDIPSDYFKYAANRFKDNSKDSSDSKKSSSDRTDKNKNTSKENLHIEGTPYTGEEIRSIDPKLFKIASNPSMLTVSYAEEEFEAMKKLKSAEEELLQIEKLLLRTRQKSAADFNSSSIFGYEDSISDDQNKELVQSLTERKKALESVKKEQQEILSGFAKYPATQDLISNYFASEHKKYATKLKSDGTEDKEASKAQWKESRNNIGEEFDETAKAFEKEYGNYINRIQKRVRSFEKNARIYTIFDEDGVESGTEYAKKIREEFASELNKINPYYNSKQQLEENMPNFKKYGEELKLRMERMATLNANSTVTLRNNPRFASIEKQMKGFDKQYRANYKKNQQLVENFDNILSKVQKRQFDTPEKANASFEAFKKQVRAAGYEVETLGGKMKNLIVNRAQYMFAGEGIFLMRQVFTDMIRNVTELDSAMTELKKVTDETDSSYDTFLENATTRAQAIGTTLTDVVSATADFARLGYNMNDASTMADSALTYLNVGDDVYDIGQASSSIISTMQAFGIQAEDTMSIVDRFNEVSNNFATSSGGIGEGLQRSAAAMAAANNTIDETIALFTAAQTVAQDADTVGTGLKTMSMRLRSSKSEVEDAGEDTEGMATSVSKLRDNLKSLTSVDIMSDANNYKSTYDILKEISKVWDDLTDVSRANVLELLFGKRQANIGSAILENFNIAEAALKTSEGSQGSATEENEKYLDSIEGRMNKFKATWETLSSTMANADVVKGVVSAGGGILKFINSLLNKISTIPLILGGISVAMSKVLGIGDSILNKGLSFDKMMTSLKEGGMKMSIDTKDVESFREYLKLSNISVDDAKWVNAQKQKEDLMASFGEKTQKAAQACDSGRVSIDRMNKAMDNGTQKGDRFTLGLSKFAGVGKTLASIGLDVGIGAAIGLATQAIGLGISKIVNYRKEAIEAMDSVTKKFDEAKQTYETNGEKINEVAKEYTLLSKGVDKNGNNINLSAESYERYKNIVGEITSMYPELIKGYDAEGNAIINRNTLLQDSIDLQKQYYESAKTEYLDSGKDILKGARAEIDNINDSKSNTMSKLSTLLGKSTMHNDKGAIIKTPWSIYDSETITNGYIHELQFTDKGTKDIIANKEDFLARYENYLREYSDLSNDEINAYKNNASSLINSLTSDVNLEDTQISKIKQYLMTSLGDAATSIPEEFQTVLDKGLEQISLKDNLDINGMKDEASTFATELSDAINNPDVEKLSGSYEKLKKQFEEGSITSEQYSNRAAKLKEQFSNLPNTINNTTEGFKNLCDVMADSIELNVVDNIVSIADAFNPMKDAIDAAAAAKENFDTKMQQTGDYGDGRESIRSTMDNIYADGSEEYKGNGSREFWAAAEQGLGSDRLKELKYDTSAVNEELKNLYSNLETGEKTTDFLYQSLYDHMSEVKEKFGKDSINYADGELSFSIDNSRYEELADILNVSYDTLVAMTEQSRQFANVDWADPKELFKAIGEAEYAVKNNKKVYVNENKLQQDSGLSPKEFEESRDAIKKANVVTLNVEEKSSNFAEKLIEANSSIGNIGKNGTSLDLSKVISQMFQMKFSSDDIWKFINKAINNNGIKFTDENGKNINKKNINKKDIDSAYKGLSDASTNIWGKDFTDTASALETINSSIDGLTFSINDLIIALGGIPVGLKDTISDIDSASNAFDSMTSNQEIKFRDLSKSQQQEIKNYKSKIDNTVSQIQKLRKSGKSDKEISSLLGYNVKDLEKYQKKLGMYMTDDPDRMSDAEVKKLKNKSKGGETVKASVEPEVKDKDLKSVRSKIRSKVKNIKASFKNDNGSLNKIKEKFEAWRKKMQEKKISVKANDRTSSVLSRIGSTLSSLTSNPYTVTVNIVSTIIKKLKDLTSGGSDNKNGGGSKPKKLKGEATGTSFAKGGNTLVGEIAPEMVWNRANNQAYMVGLNGPEIVNLDHGDVVWNHKDTAAILGRKNPKAVIPSKADGDHYKVNTKGKGKTTTKTTITTTTNNNSGRGSTKTSSSGSIKFPDLSEYYARLETEIGYTKENRDNYKKKLKQALQKLYKSHVTKGGKEWKAYMKEYREARRQYYNLISEKTIQRYSDGYDNKSFKDIRKQLKKYKREHKIKKSEYYKLRDELNQALKERVQAVLGKHNTALGTDNGYSDKRFERYRKYLKKNKKKFTPNEYKEQLSELYGVRINRIIENYGNGSDYYSSSRLKAKIKRWKKQGRITDEQYWQALDEIDNARKARIERILGNHNSVLGTKAGYSKTRFDNDWKYLKKHKSDFTPDEYREQKYELWGIKADNIVKGTSDYFSSSKGYTQAKNALKKLYNQGLISAEQYYQKLDELADESVTRVQNYFSYIQTWISDRNLFRDWSKGDNEIKLYQRALEKLGKELRKGIITWEAYLETSMEIQRAIAEAERSKYSEQHDKVKSILDMVMEMIKREKEDQIKALQEQLKNYNKIIDAKKKSLSLTQKELSYQESLDENSSKLAELQAKADVLALDDSREAKAKRNDILKEIDDLQKDIYRSQRDNAFQEEEEMLGELSEKYGEYVDEAVEAINKSMESVGDNIKEAVERIANTNFNELFEQLYNYNYKYGDGWNSTIDDLKSSTKDILKEYLGSDGKLNTSIDTIIDLLKDKAESVSSTTPFEEMSENYKTSSSVIEKMRSNEAKIKSRQAKGQDASDLISENAQLAAYLQTRWSSTYGDMSYKNGHWYTQYQGKETDLYKTVSAKGKTFTQLKNEWLDIVSKYPGKQTTQKKYLDPIFKDLKTLSGYSNAIMKWNSNKHKYEFFKSKNPPGAPIGNNVIAIPVKNIPVFHTGLDGGFVGNDYTPKQSESYALLRNDELVLNKNDQLRIGNQLAALKNMRDLFAASDISFDKYGTNNTNNVVNIEVSTPITIEGSADEEVLKKMNQYTDKITDKTLGNLENALKRSGFTTNMNANLLKK